jgi:hypothetical protein
MAAAAATVGLVIGAVGATAADIKVLSSVALTSALDELALFSSAPPETSLS